MKYHINPETGVVGQCSARLRECRFKLSEEKHFTHKEEAEQAVEEEFSKRFGGVRTMDKRTSSKEKSSDITSKSLKNPSFTYSDQPEVQEWRERFSKKITVVEQEEADALIVAMVKERAELEAKVDCRPLDYYSMAGFANMNYYLRHGSGRVSRNGAVDDLKTTKTMIERMDKIFKHAVKDEERDLYRYQNINYSGAPPEDYALSQYPVGGVVEEASYISTTEDAGVVLGLLNKRSKEKTVVFHIISKDGVSLQRDEEESPGAIQSLEKERLLPSGKRFRVVGHKTETLKAPKGRDALKEGFSKSFSYTTSFNSKKVFVVMLLDEELISGK